MTLNVNVKPSGVLDTTVFANVRWLVFMLAHVLLGLVVRPFPYVIAIHAVGVLVVGLLLVVRSDRHYDCAAFACAYIAGSEVLWRIASAPIIWEFAKYSGILLACTSFIRSRNHRLSPVALIYLLLLLPSVVVTLFSVAPDLARQKISFNLSGPVALMVMTCFFSRLTISRSDMVKVLLYALSPIISVLTVSGVATYGGSAIQYTGEASFAASGGFGPDQVGAILALGSLLSFIAILLLDTNRFVRASFVVLLIACSAQSVMTFSRGGIYMVGLAIVASSMFLIQSPRLRGRIVALSITVFLLGDLWLLHRLDEYTRGALSTRLTDTGTTGRDLLVKADLQAFIENPILGVGPGGSDQYHERYFRGVSAHTEFTRLPAEHGILGAIALVLMFVIAANRVGRTRDPVDRGVSVAMIVWALSYLAVNGMRLYAPSLIFGLATATTAFGVRSHEAAARRDRVRCSPNSVSAA